MKRFGPNKVNQAILMDLGYGSMRLYQTGTDKFWSEPTRIAALVHNQTPVAMAVGNSVQKLLDDQNAATTLWDILTPLSPSLRSRLFASVVTHFIRNAREEHQFAGDLLILTTSLPNFCLSEDDKVEICSELEIGSIVIVNHVDALEAIIRNIAKPEEQTIFLEYGASKTMLLMLSKDGVFTHETYPIGHKQILEYVRETVSSGSKIVLDDKNANKFLHECYQGAYPKYSGTLINGYSADFFRYGQIPYGDHYPKLNFDFFFDLFANKMIDFIAAGHATNTRCFYTGGTTGHWNIQLFLNAFIEGKAIEAGRSVVSPKHVEFIPDTMHSGLFGIGRLEDAIIKAINSNQGMKHSFLTILKHES